MTSFYDNIIFIYTSTLIFHAFNGSLGSEPQTKSQNKLSLSNLLIHMKCLLCLYQVSREIRQEFICLMLISGSKCVHLKLSSGCEPLALVLQTRAGISANIVTSRRRRRALLQINMFLYIVPAAALFAL